MKEAMQHVNRLSYLLHCNERDAEVMPQIIDFLMNLQRKFDVDMLKNISLSACTSQIRCNFCYKDFDINANYDTEVKTTFKLSEECFKDLVEYYDMQDTIKCIQ
jgi:hypothetical protein